MVACLYPSCPYGEAVHPSFFPVIPDWPDVFAGGTIHCFLATRGSIEWESDLRIWVICKFSSSLPVSPHPSLGQPSRQRAQTAHLCSQRLQSLISDEKNSGCLHLPGSVVSKNASHLRVWGASGFGQTPRPSHPPKEALDGITQNVGGPLKSYSSCFGIPRAGQAKSRPVPFTDFYFYVLSFLGFSGLP